LPVITSTAPTDEPGARVRTGATDGLDAVTLDGVRLAFGSVLALDDVSLQVERGEILFLLGPSGSGKSSLLRIVAGIERPDRGRVCLSGVEVDGPHRFVQPEERQVGMVFQDYALFPHLTVAANVAFGLKGSRRERSRAAGSLLDRLGVSRYADSYPHMLSGGERQRVALARALAPQPRVLLMDEPFSSLDGQLRDRVREETLDLLREIGTTTIVVTHDPQEAMRAADRIALLRGGRLLQCGTVDELYTSPASAFVAGFFGEINELCGTCERGCVDTVLGSFAAPHVADGTPVRVCIRPQHLCLSETPTDLRGRVVTTRMLGESERVVVEVQGADALLSLRVFGRSRVAAGDAVCLRVDTPHIVVTPHQEH
jgi:iron(III) transport system ATP-binding protein